MSNRRPSLTAIGASLTTAAIASSLPAQSRATPATAIAATFAAAAFAAAFAAAVDVVPPVFVTVAAPLLLVVLPVLTKRPPIRMRLEATVCREAHLGTRTGRRQWPDVSRLLR